MYVTDRIQLLRGLAHARTNNTLQDFIDGLTQDQVALISRNIQGATAHKVSRSLVTGLDHEEVLNRTASTPKSGHFNAFRSWQESLGKLPKESLDDIQSSTSDIIRLVTHNFNTGKRCYGLVVGYVQSGKTGHFSGLISRAVDEGFTCIIVLSGILNDLRRQTQIRLHKDVFGAATIKRPQALKTISPPGSSRFRFLTDIDSDIGSGEYMIIGEDLKTTLAKNQVLVGITKKNTSVLQHLLNGIMNCPKELRDKHKVLIIDDEADHATINTANDAIDFADASLEGNGDEEITPLDDDTDPSKTNLLVRKIIQKFRYSSYIGYTATPYANVLIDPFIESKELGKSLYPRDFIMNLAKPKGYFGADVFFGTEDNEGNYVVLHPENTAEELMEAAIEVESKIEEVVPLALKKAMMDFILTGVLKQYRRRRGIAIHPLHHSMLVHVSRLKLDQSVIYDMIQALIEQWKLESTSPFLRNGFLKKLKQRWEIEFRSKFEEIEQFSEFSELLLDEEGWMQEINVMMINSESEEILDYDSYPLGLNVIAVGGNKLSRGLTLEGLTVSMYMRQTKMYDSLMQMGRWFGYRHGYEDLVRVHTTERIYSWFEWLVKAEQAVRNDIDRYAALGVHPTEVAVRIPWHEELIPTARNKMKYAIKNIYNYSNRTTESVHLPIYDPAKLKHNFSVTNKFFQSIGAPSDLDKQGYLWSDVSKSSIIELLDTIELPGPPTAAFDTSGLVKFIQKTAKLEDFIVIHAGRDWEQVSTTPNASIPQISLPHGMKPRYVGRSQLGVDGEGTGNIRVISSPNDIKKAEKASLSKPALLVYFVAPGSKNTRNTVTRVDLPTGPTPIVGIALRFPETEGPLSDVRAALTVRGLKGDLNE